MFFAEFNFYKTKEKWSCYKANKLSKIFPIFCQVHSGKHSSHPARLFRISGLKNRWMEKHMLALSVLLCFLQLSHITNAQAKQWAHSFTGSSSTLVLSSALINISFTSSHMDGNSFHLLFTNESCPSVCFDHAKKQSYFLWHW